MRDQQSCHPNSCTALTANIAGVIQAPINSLDNQHSSSNSGSHQHPRKLVTYRDGSGRSPEDGKSGEDIHVDCERYTDKAEALERTRAWEGVA